MIKTFFEKELREEERTEGAEEMKSAADRWDALGVGQVKKRRTSDRIQMNSLSDFNNKTVKHKLENLKIGQRF